ncbi:hypothetical protein [Deinococcus frigens]|uniref:hypothetical protein n=1 Tax=Deinococcus frigens TaxID=249403 RepID=UPI0004950894|nr:hypothetical protein [Deinococcus frigens]
MRLTSVTQPPLDNVPDLKWLSSVMLAGHRPGRCVVSGRGAAPLSGTEQPFWGIEQMLPAGFSVTSTGISAFYGGLDPRAGQPSLWR